MAFGPHPDDMWQRPLDVGVFALLLLPVSLLAHRWIEVPLRNRSAAQNLKTSRASGRPSQRIDDRGRIPEREPDADVVRPDLT